MSRNDFLTACVVVAEDLFGNDENAIMTAAIILSAFHVGTSRQPLSNFCGVPKNFVGRIVKRMKQAGIWRYRAIYLKHWDDHEVVGFSLDVLTAQGFLKVVWEKGEPYWGMVENYPPPSTSRRRCSTCRERGHNSLTCYQQPKKPCA